MTRWFVGDLATGRITQYLSVSSGSWQTELNGPGSIQVTVPLSDPDVAALQIRNLATVGKTFLGVSENGIVLNAGPVWSHSYSADDRTVDLSATGLWTFLKHRLVLPAVPAGVLYPDGYDTNLNGLDSGTVIKRILQQAVTVGGGSLPLLFQPDVAGSSQVTYFGQELTTVADALDDYVSNGIDIDFAPQFTGDGTGVQWFVRTGTDGSPLLSAANPNNPPTWDMSVPHSAVKGLQVALDGSSLTGRVWESTGSSGGLSARYDNPALQAQGYPFLESVDSSHSSEDDQIALNGYAREAARLGSRPTELWSFQVRAASQPLVGSYRVGDMCAVRVGVDPYVPRGSYSRRITNLAGDQDGKWVSVTTGQTYSLTG